MRKTPSRIPSRNREVSAFFQGSDLIFNSNFIDELLNNLNEAKFSVLVCAYSWKWYDLEPELQIQKFNTLLLAKMRQGVRVELLVDSLVDHRFFSDLGFKVAVVPKQKTLHAKAVCFDYKVLALGSHNLTKHATLDNYETTIFTDDANLVTQFVDYFYKLWEVYG